MIAYEGCFPPAGCQPLRGAAFFCPCGALIRIALPYTRSSRLSPLNHPFPSSPPHFYFHFPFFLPFIPFRTTHSIFSVRYLLPGYFWLFSAFYFPFHEYLRRELATNDIIWEKWMRAAVFCCVRLRITRI